MRKDAGLVVGLGWRRLRWVNHGDAVAAMMGVLG